MSNSYFFHSTMFALLHKNFSQKITTIEQITCSMVVFIIDKFIVQLNLRKGVRELPTKQALLVIRSEELGCNHALACM